MLTFNYKQFSLIGSLLILFTHVTIAADNTNSVSAGELVLEPPTLISLGLEWYIEGDNDRDAMVEVAYRKSGERRWQEGLPLLRVQNEVSLYDQTLDYTAPNMFAGSIFYLEPDTDYDVQLTMTDPDGVIGRAERTVTMHTRAEPEAFSGGRVFHVYPMDHTGPEEQPAYHGLVGAYYMAGLGGDWSRASAPRVRAGDTLLVHAGVYQEFNRRSYTHEIDSGYTTCCGTTWDGTYYLTADGTEEMPITIKAAGDGEVIFDGADNYVLFNMMGGDWHLFEGITFAIPPLPLRQALKALPVPKASWLNTAALKMSRPRFTATGPVPINFILQTMSWWDDARRNLWAGTTFHPGMKTLILRKNACWIPTTPFPYTVQDT